MEMNEHSQFCHPDEDGHCAICADEGVPAQVLSLQPFEMALVAMNGRQQEVALDLVDNVQIGDWLLIHVGVAIAKLEREESG